MKLTKSLHNIKWKLFFALFVMGLCPAVWTTVRTFFIGQLPGEWSYSIAGQLSWVNLLYEIKLVMVLFGFYVLYAIQNVFDSTFYGRGKTSYMLFESVVTNTVYYGTFFVLYLTGAWVPTLIGIALMFGIGNAFDSIVSGAAYAYFLKKNKINILNVE